MKYFQLRDFITNEERFNLKMLQHQAQIPSNISFQLPHVLGPCLNQTIETRNLPDEFLRQNLGPIQPEVILTLTLTLNQSITSCRSRRRR